MSVRNILDGTISPTGLGPDSELTVGTVAADYLLANTAVMSKGVDGKTTSINGAHILTGKVEVSGKTVTNSLLAAESITSRGNITTPALTLGETPVLTPTDSDSNQYIAITYGERDEETLSVLVHSKVCNFNNEMHMLTCQTTLTSLTKAIKQVIIPTGLDFTGRQTVSHNTTVALINGTDLLLGMFTSTWKATS